MVSYRFVKTKKGKKMPPFIKQRKELRWNLLRTPFMSNEPGTARNKGLNVRTKVRGIVVTIDTRETTLFPGH
jgi:hypothetical protein